MVDARPWKAAALDADRFGKGRVFLAGDSAHVMPPTGGFGGNTGIHDAYNLAWKLEAVLKNHFGIGLLDTHDAERPPVADATMAQALARLQAWFKDPSGTLPPPVPIVDDTWVIFGYRYPIGALIAERDDTAATMFDDPRAPSGRPGSRAPHLIVRHAGADVSTIDLFAGKWVLHGGPKGKEWAESLRRTSSAAALGVVYHGIEPAGDLQDVNQRWAATYGLDADGAVLIRPDGFVAWRRRAAHGDAHGDLNAFDGLVATHQVVDGSN